MISVTLKDESNTRLLIAETGMTLKSFSEKVGVSHPYLSQVLSGKRNPSPTVAGKIAEGLDKEINEIFLISNVAKDNLGKSGEVIQS